MRIFCAGGVYGSDDKAMPSGKQRSRKIDALNFFWPVTSVMYDMIYGRARGHHISPIEDSRISLNLVHFNVIEQRG